VSDAGESALTNEKVIELPGCTAEAELLARNSMPKPSVEPRFVIDSVQPAGGETDIGLVAIRSSPGTHEYQNVPMAELLELELLSVRV
jgi:hypothetical protein